MSGIKNIKKKLKGFQVRPPNVEVIKKVLLHIPYVVVFYVVNKSPTALYRLPTALPPRESKVIV